MVPHLLVPQEGSTMDSGVGGGIKHNHGIEGSILSDVGGHMSTMESGVGGGIKHNHGIERSILSDVAGNITAVEENCVVNHIDNGVVDVGPKHVVQHESHKGQDAEGASGGQI